MDRPLFRSRKRLAQKAEKAAAGEPVSLSVRLGRETRTKICYAMVNCSPKSVEPGFQINPGWSDVGSYLRRRLLETWGWTTPLSGNMNAPPEVDVLAFVTDGATDEEVIEVVEAWFDAVESAWAAAFEGVDSYLPGALRTAAVVEGPSMQEIAFGAFRGKVNAIFDSDDIGYQLVGTGVVERTSMVMHADILAPVMSLLGVDPKFAAVERAYQDALRELKPEGNPSDAITDAATALQEMLELMGANGNALGPLMKDATKKGMLRPYDVKLVDWTSASRSDRGDAHSASVATSEEAWLVVHVVGALMLHLEQHRP